MLYTEQYTVYTAHRTLYLLQKVRNQGTGRVIHRHKSCFVLLGVKGRTVMRREEESLQSAVYRLQSIPFTTTTTRVSTVYSLQSSPLTTSTTRVPTVYSLLPHPHHHLFTFLLPCPEKGELLFSSVEQVKLIHGHWLRPSSKMHHLLAQ